MERSCRSRASKLIVLTTIPLVLLGVVTLVHASGQASWRITLHGTDITAACAPIDRGALPSINVSSIAPALGLTVRCEAGAVTIIDTSGSEWKARNGAITFESGVKSVRMSCPLLLQGTAAYASVDAVAELAGLKYSIGSVARRIELSSKLKSQGAVADGWESFTLAKSLTEKRDGDVYSPSQTYLGRGREQDLKLPATRESLHASYGLGYVQDAPFGGDFSLYGKLRGQEITLGTTFAVKNGGLRTQSGRLSLYDREYGWGAEAGELYTEIWGTSKGLRYSWQGRGDRWPSFSIYFNGNGHKPVVSYRDELSLGKLAGFGGEIASDGSVLLRSRFDDGKFGLFSYVRNTPARTGDGSGAFASINIGGGLSLYSSISRSNDSDGERLWRSISLRIPIRREMDLILERSTNGTSRGREGTDAAMLTIPIGPLRVMSRYENRNSGRIGLLPYSGWSGLASKEMMTSALYNATPKLGLDLQMNTRWAGGDGQQWRQLISTYRVSPSTQVEAFSAFPKVLDLDQTRLRLTHDLSDGRSLAMDYGRLSPTSSVGEKSPRVLRILMQKKWNLGAPARGGRVHGVVADQGGRGLPGVIVKLGKYQALTDKDGKYSIRCVPSGSYKISIDTASLPADYAQGTGEKTLEIDAKSRIEQDFSVVPLNSIEGRVFLDKDGDDTCDAGEGVDGVVVRRGEAATMSGEDGEFGFYNVEPGSYTIEVDPERVPDGYQLIDGASKTTVELQPSRAAEVTLRIEMRVKPIVFQDL